MDVVVKGNSISTDDASICKSDIKITAKGASVTGNTLTNVGTGFNIAQISSDVVVDGNTVTLGADPAGGLVNIDMTGLKSYIDNRSDYLASYTPMSNIVISNNVFTHTDATAPTYGYGFRIYGESAVAEFPEGQLIGLCIKGNSIANAKYGVYVIAPDTSAISITDNKFVGKAFVRSGFSGSTVLNSRGVLGCYYTQVSNLRNISFCGNSIYGFENLYDEVGGSATAGTVFPPHHAVSNHLMYLNTIRTTGYRGISYTENFSNNSGAYIVDRAFMGQWALNNSMGDATLTTNSYRKSRIQYVGAADVRLYYDDAASFVQLA